MAPTISRKTQLGRESTAGTMVAASSVWRGNATWEDMRAHVDVDEQIGIDGGAGREFDTTLGARINFEDTPLSTNHVVHILSAGIKEVSAVGANPYTYTYPFPTTAAQTIKTYSIEVGNSYQESEAEYCFVESFNIKGASGGSTAEPVTMGATWMGRQWTDSTYTGALAVTTPYDLMFAKSKAYLGAVGTAFGSLTQITSGFLGFDLKVTTGFKPRFYGEGALYFTAAQWLGMGLDGILCDVQMEYNATSAAEIANWRSKTPRKFQVKCEGASLGGTVGAYTLFTVDIQLVGSWVKFTGLENVDEGDTVTGTFRCHYDATAAERGNIIVATTLASIP